MSGQAWIYYLGVGVGWACDDDGVDDDGVDDDDDHKNRTKTEQIDYDFILA